MNNGRFVAAGELQDNPSVLLQQVNSNGEICYITEDGRAKAVLLDINRWHALCDLVEETETPSEFAFASSAPLSAMPVRSAGR